MRTESTCNNCGDRVILEEIMEKSANGAVVVEYKHWMHSNPFGSCLKTDPYIPEPVREAIEGVLYG